MKRIILLILVFALSQCEINVKEAKAYGVSYIRYEEEIVSGMTYRIWYVGRESNSEDIFQVVNLTKDALECEYYRKQLEILNKKK